MLSDLFEQYLLRNLRDSSPETIRLWRIALRHFDRFLKRPAALEDFNDATVCKFSMWRREKVSAATVNRDLACILALWRWANRRGFVALGPDVPLLPVPKRVPIAWMQPEFNRLLSTARNVEGSVGRVPAADWWTALLLVLFDSAERIRAVMSLTWPNVDLSNQWVVFRAETRKGGHEDNLVRIAPDTAKALGQIRQHPERVFHWPYNPTYLWHRYAKLLKAAGLPTGRTRMFHAVRRTTASFVEAAGGNATAILGHASRATTLRYLDPRISQRPQAIDLLWRPQ